MLWSSTLCQQTRVIASRKSFECVSTSFAFLYGSRVPEASLAQLDLFAQLQFEGSFVRNLINAFVLAGES